MSRPKKQKRSKIADKIIAAMDEAVSFASGVDTDGEVSVVEVLHATDIAALRQSLGMTREEFADAYGFTYRTIENYEKHLRKPNRQVQYYLRAIKNNPLEIFNAVHGG